MGLQSLVELNLRRASDLALDCHAAYRTAPPLIRRLMNQAEAAPMRFIEVHARVERLLGPPVAKLSVKNYPAKRSKGRRPLFERVSHGHYRIRMS